jgi:hypothetical protein
MSIISDNVQNRWRDCLSTSEQVKLTLRTNGEERTQVITPDGQMVDAGFDAPESAATLVVSSGGTLTANATYYYVYVYASTQYPYVQNAQTVADGELWPRSNPSPISAAGTTTGSNKTITVTVTKTTASNIDRILVYRTTGHTSAAESLASAQAGLYYYIATVTNNGSPGTLTVTDNGLTDTGELIELDNYKADTAWFNVFDGKYWWASGNPELPLTVTLNGTSQVAISATNDFFIFDGRSGQIATFDSVTDGGFDSKGSFYVGVDAFNQVTLYSDPELTATLAVAYSGVTVMRVRGRSSVLYRSKAFNPFSWGFTELILNADGSNTTIPQSFALEMGGGSVSAMAVSNNGKLLIVHFETPQRTISLDLELAESDQFGDTLKIIDDTNSVTAHFTQFHGLIGNSTILLGLDTFNGNVLACDGYRQTIVSANALGAFPLSLDRTDHAHRFFHGEFDPTTQLNCFWVRYYDTTEVCNVLIWNHADSGQWGWTPDFSASCSAQCQDPDTNERFLIGGTEYGHVGRLFNTEFYDQWMNGTAWRDAFLITSPSLSGGFYVFSTLTTELAQVTQGITYVSEFDDFFETDGTPSMAVGDTIYLIETDNFFVESKTVVSIDGNTVTIDSPWTFGGVELPTLVFVSPSRCTGLWSVISNAAGTNFWMVKLTSTGVSITEQDITLTWRIDQYIERGTTEVLVTDGAPPFSTGDPIFFNAIPCLYRTYFDLNTPTKDKRANEFWTTAENVDTHFGAGAVTFSGRYYQEFEEASTPARTFQFKQNKRTPTSASADSNVWLTKTGVPTYDLKQFGMEMCQLGYEAFALYNYTIKVKPD